MEVLIIEAELLVLFVKRLGELVEATPLKISVHEIVELVEHSTGVSFSPLFQANPWDYSLGP